MKQGIYEEYGWVAEVNILFDDSNDEWERYSLEVVSTIHESPAFYVPANGHTFKVSALRKFRPYVDWKLQIKEINQ